MFIKKFMLTAVAFTATASGFAGAAHADQYFVRLDCHGNPGFPSWAPTSNTITVKTKINNVWSTICTRTPTDCSSETSVPLCSGPFSMSLVQAISVTTNGSNAFWLDKLVLSSPTGSDQSWGADNTTGYCFSTNAADGNSQHCLNGVAHTTLVFD